MRGARRGCRPKQRGHQVVGDIGWDERRDAGEAQLEEPAVQAPLVGDGVQLGSEVRAVLTEMDLLEGRVQFRVA